MLFEQIRNRRPSLSVRLYDFQEALPCYFCRAKNNQKRLAPTSRSRRCRDYPARLAARRAHESLPGRSDTRFIRRAAALLGGLKSRETNEFTPCQGPPCQGLDPDRVFSSARSAIRSLPGSPSAQPSTAGQNREKRGPSERSQTASSAAPVLIEERRGPVAKRRASRWGAVSFAYFIFGYAAKSRAGACRRAYRETACMRSHNLAGIATLNPPYMAREKFKARGYARGTGTVAGQQGPTNTSAPGSAPTPLSPSGCSSTPPRRRCPWPSRTACDARSRNGRPRPRPRN